MVSNISYVHLEDDSQFDDCTYSSWWEISTNQLALVSFMSFNTVDDSEIWRENHLTGMKPMVNNNIFIISTGEHRIFWAINSSSLYSMDSFHLFIHMFRAAWGTVYFLSKKRSWNHLCTKIDSASNHTFVQKKKQLWNVYIGGVCLKEVASPNNFTHEREIPWI